MSNENPSAVLDQEKITYAIDQEKKSDKHSGKIRSKVTAEKSHKEKLLAQIARDYRIDKNIFYFKDYPYKLAFKDKGNKLISGMNDERVSFTMAMMAEARGWQKIQIKGHPDFCRMVWMEASLRDIHVTGFTPQARDFQALENHRARLTRNTIEKYRNAKAIKNTQGIAQKTKQPNTKSENEKAKPDPSRVYEGYLIMHGVAPYEYNPVNKQSYFVKLTTASGEKTIWGVDLKRTLKESKAKKGDAIKLAYRGNQPITVRILERNASGKVIGAREIETHRNTWNAEKTDKYKVAEAVASAVVANKIKNTEVAQIAMSRIQQRLDQRVKEGRIPTLLIYDKNAKPKKAQKVEHTMPQVEQHAERTRE